MRGQVPAAAPGSDSAPAVGAKVQMYWAGNHYGLGGKGMKAYPPVIRYAERDRTS